jgi:hypothetical protein
MTLPDWYVHLVLWAFHLSALSLLLLASLYAVDYAFKCLLQYLGAWNVVLKALVRHVREKQAAAGR